METLFQPVALVDAVGDDGADLRALMLGVVAQRRQHIGQRAGAPPIEHTLAVATRLDEARASQMLEVL